MSLMARPELMSSTSSSAALAKRERASLGSWGQERVLKSLREEGGAREAMGGGRRDRERERERGKEEEEREREPGAGAGSAADEKEEEEEEEEAAAAAVAARSSLSCTVQLFKPAALAQETQAAKSRRSPASRSFTAPVLLLERPR